MPGESSESVVKTGQRSGAKEPNMQNEVGSIGGIGLKHRQGRDEIQVGVQSSQQSRTGVGVGIPELGTEEILEVFLQEQRKWEGFIALLSGP